MWDFKVENYEDHDVVCTRLVILKGYLLESSEPWPSNVSKESVDIYAAVYTDDCLRDASFPVKVTNNGFLTVLELFNGKNTILLGQSVGNTDYFDEFHLTYQPKPIEGSVRPNFILKPLLIVAKDEELPPINHVSILTRISIALELMQTFFSEKLYAARLGRRSFNLGVGQVFQTEATKENLLEMNTTQVWEMLGREIMADSQLWHEETKYVAFLSHPWKDLIDSSAQHSALGGGGLALLHSDFVTIWPDSVEEILQQLDNPRKAEPGTCKTLIPFHESIGRLYGASLGQVAHELGHIFDLGHTEVGLMGTDFHRFSLCLMPPATDGSLKSRLRSFSISTKKYSPKPNAVFLPTGDRVDDVVQLQHSSVIILYNNRWFQPDEVVFLGKDYNIEIHGNLIKSTRSLSALEIRDKDTGLVLFSKTFEDASSTTAIGRRDIPLSHSNIPVLIFVQDKTGLTFKTSLERSSLPEIFTSVRRRQFP